MSQQAAPIACPNCKSLIPAQISQLLDVRQEPAVKARLLSGSLNHIQCPVCGYQGQLATPLVYHDPSKELLLSYIPVELGLPKDESEKAIGRLINRAIDGLPKEERKGYLLQPQAVLTMQGLIERVLEADGVTREELDEQREKARLFESLIRTPDEGVPAFVKEHDQQLDGLFFQLASLSLGATPEGPARQAARAKIDQALRLSSYGAQLQQREAEFRAAAESLQAAGASLTREKLMELVIGAPSDGRVEALVSLIRPALDYTFFQLLSEKIEAAAGTEAERLTRLRARLLELTEAIDQAQEARAARAAGLLRSLMQAEDLDQALQAALPLVDELFLGVLQANLRAAEGAGNSQSLARLQEIDRRLHQAIYESLPPGLQLAQRLLQLEDESEADRILAAAAGQIDEDTLGALLGAAQRLEGSDAEEAAARLRRLHRKALRLSMKAKLAGD